MKTSKIFLCVTFIISVFYSFDAKSKTNNFMFNDTIKSICIQFVNFDLFTIADVECDKFMSSFSKQIKTINITDNSTIEKIKDILLNLRSSNEKSPIDTRAKMQIINSDTIQVCIDPFYLEMLGEFYHTPLELIELIDPCYYDDW